MPSNSSLQTLVQPTLEDVTALERRVAERERDLLSAKTELQQLQVRYLSELGALYAELNALDEELAQAEIKAGLDDTWFAWSGATTADPGRNITAYYRIQGPNLVIEYAPQPLGGDPSLHLHTMYRDPTNDYGRTVTGK